MRVIIDWNALAKSCNQVLTMSGWLGRKGKRDLLLPYIPPVVFNVDIPNNRVDVEILGRVRRWRLDILTLFQRCFLLLEHSNRWKGTWKRALDIQYHNFREYAEKARYVRWWAHEVVRGCCPEPNPLMPLMLLKKKTARYSLLDPAGKQLDYGYAGRIWAKEEELIFTCGHMRAGDERIKTLVTGWDFLGDYVLTGGELAAGDHDWCYGTPDSEVIARSLTTKMIVFRPSRIPSVHSGPMIIVAWLCRYSESGHHERFVSGDCMRVSKET